MKFQMNKREFLNVAIRAPLLFIASYAGLGVRLGQASAPEGALFSDAERAVLERMCYLLFPYPDAGNGIYKRCVDGLALVVHEQADNLVMIKAGVETLDSMAEGAWISADEELQILLLNRIESEAFFQLVYRVVLDQIYTDKAVWDIVGYEGSSLEFGGYLNRGFNDIDWL